jgi:hypothetical protein
VIVFPLIFVFSYAGKVSSKMRLYLAISTVAMAFILRENMRVVLILHDIIRFGGLDWLSLETKGSSQLLLAHSPIVMLPWDVSGVSHYWADSTIRSWLNNKFVAFFDEFEQSRIESVAISNERNPWFGTNGGPDTNDYIFLLSLSELVKYFGDSGQLAKKPYRESFIDDQYNDSRMVKFNNYNVGWWLRSTGMNSAVSAIVWQNGTIHVSGLHVSESNAGIRPAMWIKF